MNISDHVFQAYPVGRFVLPTGPSPRVRTFPRRLEVGGVLTARLFRDRIKIYPERPRTRWLNRFLSYWGFPGSFRYQSRHYKGEKAEAEYVDRWPFPDVAFFPGMTIDRGGHVVNGDGREKRRQEELTRLLEYWHLYLKKHPIPAARADDCPFCRGVREPAADRATLFDEWNHFYRHLKSGWVNGTFIDLALKEWGYGEYGRRLLRGEEDGLAGYEVIFRAVRRYVYLRAGIPLGRGEEI